jgi:hypothetical protein
MIEYTVKVNSSGDKFWFVDGKRHREDGPACEYSDGSKVWCLNDELHREDGPAYEGSNGSKYWYLNDEFHREDGPAVELSNGSKSWYLNGKELTKGEFNERMNPKDSCNNLEGKIIMVDGKQYKLTEVE